MSQPAQDIIDLTDEPSSPPPTEASSFFPSAPRITGSVNRGPRYERDIIDIDGTEDEARNASPEIQFLRSRPRSPSSTEHRPSNVQTTHGPHLHRAVSGMRGLVNTSTGARWHLPDLAQSMRIGMSSGAFSAREAGEGFGAIGNWVENRIFDAPEMNFLAPGFNLENPSRPQPQTRLPTYEAPSPPSSGFTRSPNEEDMLVCPNCDDELGTGDDDVKKQVWVVKACGHVIRTIHLNPQVLTLSLGLLWRVHEAQVLIKEKYAQRIDETKQTLLKVCGGRLPEERCAFQNDDTDLLVKGRAPRCSFECSCQHIIAKALDHGLRCRKRGD